MNSMHMSLEKEEDVISLPNCINHKGYGCSLMKLTGSFKTKGTKTLFLCCDFVEDCTVHERMLHVLCTIKVFSRKEKTIMFL